ncbi:unnamed protein product, partial [marine sediment metagenome]
TDPTTSRHLLVGFKVREMRVVMKSGLIAMEIHFAEATPEEFTRYRKMLDTHRTQQEEAMIARRARRKSRSQTKGGGKDG